jgi:hypothetical protein
MTSCCVTGVLFFRRIIALMLVSTRMSNQLQYHIRLQFDAQKTWVSMQPNSIFFSRTTTRKSEISFPCFVKNSRSLQVHGLCCFDDKCLVRDARLVSIEATVEESYFFSSIERRIKGLLQRWLNEGEKLTRNYHLDTVKIAMFLIKICCQEYIVEHQIDCDFTWKNTKIEKEWTPLSKPSQN